MAGPISFSHPIVWDFLREHGYVATFRTPRRKTADCDTWCNRGRGEEKEFDVHIQEAAHADLTTNGGVDDLKHFAPMSGFATVSGWRRAIKEVNGELPEEGWVYVVTTTQEGDR